MKKERATSVKPVKFTCPCCGYKSLDSPRDYEICHLCFWEDGPLESGDPDFAGGANGDLTLREAQKNFILYGACDEGSVRFVRQPGPDDERDPAWKPFDSRKK